MVRLLYFVFFLVVTCEGKSSPAQLTDLTGHHFKIVIAEHVGGTSFERDSKGNIIGYSGFMIELLKWLAARLKFNYTLVFSTYQVDPLPNGTWTGVYGLLVNKKVDFVFASMAMNSDTFQFADFTATVHEDPMVILTPPPSEESRIAAIVKPFSWKVWTLFIASAVAVTLVLYFALGMNLLRKNQNAKPATIQDIFIYHVQLICGQGGFQGSTFKSLVYRMILCGWILGIIVLVNSYTGTFMSYATVAKFGPQVKTIEDLAYRSELQPVVVRGVRELMYLKPQSEPFQVLGEKLKTRPQNVVPTAADAITKVGTGCCAFLHPKTLLSIYMYRDFQETGQCRATIGETPYLWHYYTVVAQKKNPFTTLLSREILRARDMGLLAHWNKIAKVAPYKCSNPEKPKLRPLAVKDISGPFIFLLGGISASLAVFVFERALRPKRNIKAAVIQKDQGTSLRTE